MCKVKLFFFLISILKALKIYKNEFLSDIQLFVSIAYIKNFFRAK